jgi:hypothetical protein
MTTPQDPYATPPEGTPGSAHATPHDSSGGRTEHDGGNDPSGHGTSNGVGTAALVVGVLALLTSWLVFGGLLGLVAIVLGVIGLGKVKRREASNKGMAIAGIVLGVLSILVAGAIIAAGAAIFNSDTVQNFGDCLQEAGDDSTAVQECERQFEDAVQN